MPNADWTVNSSCLNGVIQAARSLGAPVDQLLERVGIDAGALAEPETRHPVAQLHEFYRLAAQATTPDIGIYAGRIDYINRINLQLYTSGVCSSFREYLNIMPSVLQLAGDIGEVLVRTEGDLIRLDWEPLWVPSPEWRFQADESLTTSVMIVNSLCVRPIPVLRACFSYSEPEDTTLLRQTFGNELTFGESRSSLYFDRASLNYPLIQLEADWAESIGRSIEHLFTGPDTDPVLGELRSCLIRLLPTGGVSIDRAAESLSISRRTLQRRLSERGTQFGQVLQDLRHELAIQYLADERLSITDIAFLLGYSDQGSFSTAFKARSGLSPRDYRKR